MVSSVRAGMMAQEVSEKSKPKKTYKTKKQSKNNNKILANS